ncbi:MAG: hybrid sensor histidine kinase/response regulator, partial [Opitutaceae bacterium]
ARSPRVKTRTVTIVLGFVVCLLIAGAIVPLVLHRAEQRIEEDLAAIWRASVASKELQLASMRLMAATENQAQARAAWSETLASSDAAIRASFSESGVRVLPDSEREQLKVIWEDRRRAALETVGLIDALTARGANPAITNSSALRAASARRLQAKYAEEEAAFAEFDRRLNAAATFLSHRLQPYDRVSFWFSVASAVGLLLAAVALPLHVRKVHRRFLADGLARREAELAARASERDLLITLHSIGDAVIATDSGGRILRLNEVAEHLTGWKQPDALGRAASDVLKFVDANATSLRDSVTDVLRTGAPVVRSTGVELMRADGSRRHVSENAAPIRDERGEIHGVVIVLHDTTIQRALEARLRDVQRMESIGRLAGGVAHEFNNLLQIIVGNSSLLRTQFPARDGIPDYFDRIGQAVQRAATLTNQLLAFGGRQTLVLKTSDLSALIARGIEVARRFLPAEISIEYEKPPVPAMAQIDSTQMEQVIVNLCLHARDSMPKGGRIRFVLDEVEIGGMPTQPAAPARIGPCLRIRFSDTGDGMTDEMRRRVFEPFFSSSGSVLDAGLGLAAVHGIVQQHGGFVEVDSAAGKGTMFTVLIPRRSALLDKPARSAPHIRVPSMRGKILIAEDEPGVRLMAVRVLERQGFEPIATADGEEACKAFADHPDDICVVLLDVIMPRMGGVEVARSIRRSNPGVPIIFCTGYADGVLGDLQLEKPWKVLHKPYGVQELVDAIDHCLAGGEVRV